MTPWTPVRLFAMSEPDLRPYLLSRMDEMRHANPGHWEQMRQDFIEAFGKPGTVEESLQGEDRQLWWLHNFGTYRVDCLKRRQGIKA